MEKSKGLFISKIRTNVYDELKNNYENFGVTKYNMFVTFNETRLENYLVELETN